MKSPGHRDNILRADITHIGVGVYQNANGYNDLIGRDSKGRLYSYLGAARGTFPTKKQIGHGW